MTGWHRGRFINGASSSQVSRTGIPVSTANCRSILMEARRVESNSLGIHVSRSFLRSIFRVEILSSSAKLANIKEADLQKCAKIACVKYSHDALKLKNQVASIMQTARMAIASFYGHNQRVMDHHGNTIHAWDLPDKFNPALIDIPQYKELLFRAVYEILQPIGIPENVLRDWMFSRTSYTTLDSTQLQKSELPLFVNLKYLSA